LLFFGTFSRDQRFGSNSCLDCKRVATDIEDLLRRLAWQWLHKEAVREAEGSDDYFVHVRC
jgi:hypothetical protein